MSHSVTSSPSSVVTEITISSGFSEFNFVEPALPEVVR